MHGDLLHPGVEEAHDASVAAHPEFSRDVLGRHFVVGAFEFDVAVAVDFAFGFNKGGEEPGWQRLQGGLFALLKVTVNLPLGGAVDAPVGFGLFPVTQVSVDFEKGVEGLAFDRALFDVTDASLYFAFVLGSARPGGQGHDVVVLTKGGEFRIEFGIVNIGLEDSGLEVVEHQHARHATETAKGVLDSTDEAFGVLPRHGLGVAFARVAQGDSQQMDLLSLAGQLNPGGSVVDLSFFAGFTFHAPDTLWITRLELGHEAFDRLIRVLKGVVIDQILPDPCGMELRLELGHYDIAERFAVTLAANLKLRLGLRTDAPIEARIDLRAGGRNGTL